MLVYTGNSTRYKQELLDKINDAKLLLKKDDIFSKMCDEFGVDDDVIDIIPIRFGKIDVAAKTDHGIIILNEKLLEDSDFNEHVHYILHEISHFLQMITRTHPTQGADDGEYLENDDEIEAFQYQVEFIGEPKADEYINKLLDHHNIDEY